MRCVLKSKSWVFHKLKFIGTCSGKAYILGNGPSLKKAFADYDAGKLDFTQDSFFVNLSPLDDHFFKIRPKHFCLSDPMFYQDHKPKKEKIREMYRLLNERVDWDLNLYMAFWTEKEYEKLIAYSGITNPHIHFVRLNRKDCSNLASAWRNRLYAKGWFMPEDGTIVNTAIYVALLSGYKEIELYGVDHNMFLELRVNNKNQLCTLDSHFYDDGTPVLKPYMNCCVAEEQVFRVHEVLYIESVMFRSHDLLQQLSVYMGSHILNCTPGSMIDSYDRIDADPS